MEPQEKGMTLEAVAGASAGGGDRRRLRAGRASILVVLLACAILRLWSIGHDLPHSYYPDEIHFVNRSVAFGSGDLNPHWFHKPAFFMYLLFGEYVGYYGVSLVAGTVKSPDDFARLYLVDPTVFYLLGRLTAMLFGLAGIYVTYRVGKALAGRGAGVTAAIFLAATYAHNVSSKEVKADLPCAFFTILAFLFLLRVLRSGSWKYAVLSAATAGVGMGTKYYSIFLLVPMGLATFLNAVGEGGRPAARGVFGVLLRAASRYGMFVTMVGIFFLFFFLASPFNYLDPLWYDLNIRPMVQNRFRMLGPAKIFVKVFHLLLGGDFSRGAVGVTAIAFTLGGGVYLTLAAATRAIPRPIAARRGWGYAAAITLAAVAGILAWVAPHFTDNFAVFGAVLFTPESMGAGLATFCLVGAVILLARGKPEDLLLVVAGLTFTIIANFYQPLYAEPRHLHPLYPFLATAGAVGGSILLAGVLRLASRAGGGGGRFRIPAAATAITLLVLPGLWGTVRWNVIHGRDDTRTLALRWFEETIPADSVVLNDKEAIKLQPNESAVQRKIDLLETELDREGQGPFTQHKDRLYRHALAAARELRRRGEATYFVRILDPPWWADREREDGAYLSEVDRDLGDPLAERIPKTLETYRAEGIEFVATCSKTYLQYTSEPWRSKWPSFDRFYRELDRLTPIREFPAEPTVRPGPTVRIYRIR